MEVSRREIDVVFTKLDVDERSCAHHRRGFVCDRNGVVLFPIYTSRSSALRGGAAWGFIKDLLLSEREFREFVKCHISRDEYLEMAQERLDE